MSRRTQIAGWLVYFAGGVTLVGALVMAFPFAPAVGSWPPVRQGELNSDHCHYSGILTRYRYLHGPMGNEDPPEPAIEGHMDFAAARWNASGAVPTTLFSHGTSATARNFRVSMIDDPGTVGSAVWASSGCTTIEGNWQDESRITWNRAHYLPVNFNHRQNMAVHEIGHALGLKHVPTPPMNACWPSGQEHVMASFQKSYDCANAFGPYVNDRAAELRFKNPAVFYYRNALAGGSTLTQQWITELDDAVFRGRAAGHDWIVSFDGDKYDEGTERNVALYRSSGQGQANAKISNLPIGMTGTQWPGVLIAGNFDGVGSDGLASFYEGMWRLRQTFNGPQFTAFWFGDPGDIPLLGDWDGNGTDTIGLFRPSTGQWFFRNSNTAGTPTTSFYFGVPGDKPISGNWQPSDRHHEIGVVRGRTWYLNPNIAAGPATVTFNFPTSPTPIANAQFMLGDWNGDGVDTPGYHR